MWDSSAMGFEGALTTVGPLLGLLGGAWGCSGKSSFVVTSVSVIGVGKSRLGNGGTWLCSISPGKNNTVNTCL